MSADLFAAPHEALAPGATLLRGFARETAPGLLEAAERIAEAAPFRHFLTPGGRSVAAAMTNCGPLGWVSDRGGYGYAPLDPASGAPWPAMPAPFRDIARAAAVAAGYPDFTPDACLLNRYRPGTGMGLHQDRDEEDAASPIVSVSLGLPAVFLWGGLRRTDPARRLPLEHGDVVVWGGPARFVFHGVARLKPGAAGTRTNLTFRRARKGGEAAALTSPAP